MGVPFAGTEARSVETSLRDLVKEMNRSNRHAEDSAGAAKGTLTSIGRVEGQLVFPGRATTSRSLCACTYLRRRPSTLCGPPV